MNTNDAPMSDLPLGDQIIEITDNKIPVADCKLVTAASVNQPIAQYHEFICDASVPHSPEISKAEFN